MAGGIAERALNQFCLDGLALSITRTNFDNTQHEIYALHHDAVILIETLPDEFNGNPYGYFLKLKDDKRIKEEKRLQLQDELNESALRSNLFIKLTFITAFAAVILQVFTYILEKSESQAPQLLKRLGSQEVQIQSLQDSLHHLKK